MIEKKLAIRPSRPTIVDERADRRLVVVRQRPSSASTSGLPESWSASDPAPPGPNVSTSAANASSAAMPAMMPRGRSRVGSRVSSAASGTPSIARKNQIA